MARPLPTALITLPIPAPIAYFIIIATVLSVFSTVTFLCGSHGHSGLTRSLTVKEKRKKTVRLGGDRSKTRVLEKIKSSLSSKALVMAKLMSWRKVQDGGEAEEEYCFVELGEEHGEGAEDDAVWKKAIIKGEKCRPIDFSGKILYDCDGNRLPD